MNNTEAEILELAEKVRGWGRIHCVDFIGPENDEIKKWLLLLESLRAWKADKE